MVTVRIEERTQDEFNAVVSFDGSGEYPAKIADPFWPEEDEERLEWYFEEHLRFPFTDQVKAREAGESIKAYGETLFRQVFADRDAFAEYKTATRQGLDQLRLEILGSPEFHRTHWEALKDPDLPKPLCLYAPMVRRSRKPQTHPAGVASSPTINLLIVTPALTLSATSATAPSPARWSKRCVPRACRSTSTSSGPAPTARCPSI